jgi:hypothetical protein
MSLRQRKAAILENVQYFIFLMAKNRINNPVHLHVRLHCPIAAI